MNASGHPLKPAELKLWLKWPGLISIRTNWSKMSIIPLKMVLMSSVCGITSNAVTVAATVVVTVRIIRELIKEAQIAA